jgi:transcriptional regulator with XRE-family HTH domain
LQIELIFGKIVKSVRIKKGITQEQLALESTLGRSYISELENGKYQPTLTSLFDIARALNMNASDLVRLVELEFNNQSH